MLLRSFLNMFSMFLASYGNPREILGELEKTVETLVSVACFPTDSSDIVEIVLSLLSPSRQVQRKD